MVLIRFFIKPMLPGFDVVGGGGGVAGVFVIPNLFTGFRGQQIFGAESLEGHDDLFNIWKWKQSYLLLGKIKYLW